MKQEQSRSPLPKEVEAEVYETKVLEFSFIKAFEQVLEGKKITRKEWDNEEIYGVKKDGYLMLHKDDGKFYNWIITDGDMDANDWIVNE